MVEHYLNHAQLKAELERCLQCANKPCMHACPARCRPQTFIQQAKEGNVLASAETIMADNPLGETCGLICPDKFCMKACTRAKLDFPVNIPKIQATLVKNAHTLLKPVSVRANGYRVAVIGAGPAGLGAVDVLSRQGFTVEIFEALNRCGGALNMIPETRLPVCAVQHDAEYVLSRPNVRITYQTQIENPLDLLKRFDGVIVATGEPHILPLHIEGEALAIPYNTYLLNPTRYATKGKVAIVGGGNVATDCALTAQANGAEYVEMFVRRRLCDMRISSQEYVALLQHEINISAQSSIVKIERASAHLSPSSELLHQKEKLTIFVQKNQCVEGKWQPIPQTCVALGGFDYVIAAVGSRADTPMVHERIIYAGDCKTGGSTVVEAVASGKTAADLLAQNIMPDNGSCTK